MQNMEFAMMNITLLNKQPHFYRDLLQQVYDENHQLSAVLVHIYFLRPRIKRERRASHPRVVGTVHSKDKRKPKLVCL